MWSWKLSPPCPPCPIGHTLSLIILTMPPCPPAIAAPYASHKHTPQSTQVLHSNHAGLPNYMLLTTSSTQHSMAMHLTPTQVRLLNMAPSVGALMVHIGKLPMLLKYTTWPKEPQPLPVPTPCFSSQSLHSQLATKPLTCVSSVPTAQKNSTTSCLMDHWQ